MLKDDTKKISALHFGWTTLKHGSTDAIHDQQCIAVCQCCVLSVNWYILRTLLHSLHSLAAHKSIPTPFSSALSSTPKTLSFLPFQLQLCHIEMEELEEKLETVNTYISWVCRCLFSEMSLAICITHFLHSKSTDMSSTSQIIWKSSIWKPCRVSSSGRT